MRAIARGLYAVGVPASVVSSAAAQEPRGGRAQLGTPPTDAEAAAFVRPVNGAFPEGNVLRYGADSTGIRDSSTAINAAIAVQRATPRRPVVVIPGGRYVLASTVGVGPREDEHFGFQLHGAGTYATYLVATHGNGPVIQANRSGATIRDVSVLASPERTKGSPRSAGSGWDDNVGIYLEAPDVPGAALAQVSLENVRVLGQPSHGIVMCGPQQNNVWRYVLAQRNLGHGVVMDAGGLTGRSRRNRTLPGQLTVIDLWTLENGGHGLLICHSDPVDPLSFAYRITLLNWESDKNATDDRRRLDAFDSWINGENIVLLNAALGGSNERGGLVFAGRDLFSATARFVQTRPIMKFIAPPQPELRTGRITLFNARVLSTSPALDPAFVVEDLERVSDIRIEHAVPGNVRKWFTPGAVDCIVNDGSRSQVAEVTRRTTISDNEALRPVSGASLHLDAREQTEFECSVRYAGDKDTALSISLVGPEGARVRWLPAQSIAVDPNGSITVLNAEKTESDTLNLGVGGGTRRILIEGRIMMGNQPGALRLMAAQHKASPDAVHILEGTQLRLRRPDSAR